ncbi:hypothetical protein HMPREF9701_00373 [Delftia acidovorans CCUG 274B]|uniref:hypothetical protein n=1 Tax=Delftia acidovorans TaxID=80866 RepID=UPI000352E46F|nr:hypothetical protein [Delftia acidovorans]EPD44785.1 hypothetical protein HMPREF9701_00373 [Delftia acidovorans CCUG 274B]
MEAAKTFERDGKRYRPGDPLPEGLDAVTLAHYKRHGMVREPRDKTPGPAEKKPSAPPSPAQPPTPRRNSSPKPANTAGLQAAGQGAATDNAPPAPLPPTDPTPPADQPAAAGACVATGEAAGTQEGGAAPVDAAAAQEPAKE